MGMRVTLERYLPHYEEAGGRQMPPLYTAQLRLVLARSTLRVNGFVASLSPNFEEPLGSCKRSQSKHDPKNWDQ